MTILSVYPPAPLLQATITELHNLTDYATSSLKPARNGMDGSQATIVKKFL